MPKSSHSYALGNEKQKLLFFRFLVVSVVDEYFFVVQSVNEPDLRRVASLLDPTIFPCGTYKSLRSV